MDTSTDADPAAILEEWRKAERAATPGPLEAVTDDHGRGRLDHSVWSGHVGYYLAETVRTRDDAEFIVTARTAMPRLVAFAEAALAFHVQAVIEDMPDPFHYCETCAGHPAWPCPEVAAITAALAGKEADDA